MFISQDLRKNNIAEYLLYMWQVENIIRAFDCSLTRIRKEYIARFDYTDEQKEELTDWYGHLIRMMNQEGCREQGHLQINKVTMQTLVELHNQLLASTKFPFYNAEYYHVLPYIVELRNRGADKDENEIETCFNSLYGHDVTSAEEGNQHQYRACHQGDYHLFRDALRLLQER